MSKTTSTEVAANKFGAEMAKRLFESRKKPGGGEAAELHLSQTDLANMLAVAYEAGVGCTDPLMVTFSLRAESQVDVQRLHAVLVGRGIAYDLKSNFLEQGLPDVGVEIRAATSFVTLHAALAENVDGHVMLETLREVPLANNSFVRAPGP